jgi:hypothetical protein
MKRTIILLSILVLVISGCESPTEEINKDEFHIPLNPGSWWVYNGERINISGQPVAGSQTRDSIAVHSDYSFNDTTGALLLHFAEGQIEDSIIYSFSDEKLFTLDDNIFGVDFGNKEWLKLIDINESNYFIRSYHDEEYEVEFMDTTVTGTLNSAFNGKFLYSDTLEIAGGKIAARFYYLKFDTRYIFTHYFEKDNGEYEKILITRYKKPSLKIWVADGVGIVRYKIESYTERWEPAAPNPHFNGQQTHHQGRRFELLDYEIAD